MTLEKSFEKLICALRSLGNVISIAFFKTFKDCNMVEREVPAVTKYHCNKCNGTLIIVDHNSTKIIYECLGCGKIHKASKDRVLGRF